MHASQKWLLIVILALGWLTPTHTPTTTHAQFSPSYAEMDCPGDIPLESGVRCGILNVLENRDKPEGRTIQLPVYTLPSFADTPEPDPVVFLAGGPGQDAAIFAYYTDSFMPFRFSRDVIILEQRGTLLANPSLMCPEYGVTIAEGYLSDLPVQEAVQPAADALLQCRANYQAQGIDTNAYTTTENAADLEDLRVAMGYEQWNLYGASYGSNLALIAMRDHPDGLRSVIIESVHPATTNFFPDTPVNVANALYGSFAICAADPDCAAAYPDPEAALFEVVDRLNETPLEITTRDLPQNIFLNGRAYLFVLFNTLYQTYYLHELPRIIYDNLDGDFGDISAIAQSYLYSWGDFATVMHYTIQCTERLAYDTLDEFEAASDSLDPRLADMTDMDNFVTWAICQGMDGLYLNPADNEPIVSDVPTLLISGQYDPVTPPINGDVALETLSRGQHFVIPDAAHTPSFAIPCARQMMAMFVDAPETEVVMLCD